ncbi:MAG: DUF3293 domain-containing protein, partial [Bradymonadaceae bacterium]
MDDYQAYRQTTFEADTPVGRVKVRVGQRSPKLDRLLNFREEKTWAFLTAWNPGGTFAGEDQNRERQQALETQLSDEGFQFFSGECVPDNADWAPEQCALVLGISADEATDLAGQWDQSSVLWGEYAQEARLLDASSGEDVTEYGEAESPEAGAKEELEDVLGDLGGTVDESVEQYRREGPTSVEEAV